VIERTEYTQRCAPRVDRSRRINTLASTAEACSARRRYISLAHKRGDSWPEIGERLGRRSRLVTSDRYSHALVD
jgi:hypothetical protein